MELSFFGAGAAFNPGMDNTNAYFTDGDRFFLVDCGETTFGKLWNLPDFLRSREVTVVVTHLHCDHVGSLASLLSYSFYKLGKVVRVVHPLDTLVRLLDLLGIERRCYVYLPGLPEAGSVGFEAVEVEHVDNMVCFGYVIGLEGKRVFYSGDAVAIPEAVLEGFFAGTIDRIYMDTSLAESSHPTHGTLSYLERTIPQDLRGRVYCMHLDSDFRPVLKEKGFKAVEVLVPAGKGG